MGNIVSSPSTLTAIVMFVGDVRCHKCVNIHSCVSVPKSQSVPPSTQIRQSTRATEGQKSDRLNSPGRTTSGGHGDNFNLTGMCPALPLNCIRTKYSGESVEEQNQIETNVK